MRHLIYTLNRSSAKPCDLSSLTAPQSLSHGRCTWKDADDDAMVSTSLRPPYCLMDVPLSHYRRPDRDDDVCFEWSGRKGSLVLTVRSNVAVGTYQLTFLNMQK